MLSLIVSTFLAWDASLSDSGTEKDSNGEKILFSIIDNPLLFASSNQGWLGTEIIVN